jgi:serine/threonine-protein kinase BUR1
VADLDSKVALRSRSTNSSASWEKGDFGEISKARSKQTGQVVALKKILIHNENDGFPKTALREIKLLKQLNHIKRISILSLSLTKL